MVDIVLIVEQQLKTMDAVVLDGQMKQDGIVGVVFVFNDFLVKRLE